MPLRTCIALLTGLGLMLGTPVSAAPPVPGADCPAATRPYSADTVLLDIYINPDARAVVERHAPGFFQNLPSYLTRTTEPPTFLALITLRRANRQIAAGKGIADDDMPQVERELALIPLTPETVHARCARYDEIPPVLPKTLKSPAILVFGKINGFRDDPSVNAATAALKAMAERRHWNLVFIDNGAVFNARDLMRFRAVVWNNVSGDVLTVPQRAAFKAWIEHGGGFAGMHGSGGDPFYDWDWYVDTLVGARFIGHPGHPQFQPARVIIDDPKSAITRSLSDWTMTEEWYSFKASPRLTGAHILARLDESTYAPNEAGHDIHMGSDHPIAWTQCLGNGRSFYSAIGHRPESYSEPNSVTLLENGIAWAAGLGETTCAAGREMPRRR